jgi:hypothetical protein
LLDAYFSHYDASVYMRSRDTTMPIAVTDKAIALLASLSPAQIAGLPPAERRRLAEVCRRAAALAEPRTEEPQAGVLAQLNSTPRQG